MHDRVCSPGRMRFSFESRCRLVSLIVEGVSPQAAAYRGQVLNGARKVCATDLNQLR